MALRWRSAAGHPALERGRLRRRCSLVVVSPWFARQLSVFGSLSPSTASGKVLFIRNIGEWNSISTPANLDWLLGQGIGPLLASRVDGLVSAIVIFSVLVGGVVLVPFMLIGAWRRRRSRDFGPYLTYAVILFAFSAIVSAVHVPGGTFIHSAVALAPHGYVLGLEGVFAATAWIAARRRTWQADQAGRAFAGGTIAFLAAVAVAATLSVHATWSATRDRFESVAAALGAAGAAPDERVMSIDASGTKYWTGHPGVVLVNDPLDTIEQVVARVRHPLARPRARRRRAGSRAGARRRSAGVDRAAGLGRAGRPGDRCIGLGRAGRPLSGLHLVRRRPLHGVLGVEPMTRREAWLSAVAIFVVALVARAMVAQAIVFPQPEDTAYYVGVARNLVEGRGLVSDALWSYQTPPLVFPRPAFEVWLPLPSLLAAVPIALLGPFGHDDLAGVFRAAQIESVLVGALVPVLAWRLAADVAAELHLSLGRARTLALGAGLTTALYLPLLLLSALPDSTMPFAVLALAACLLMVRVARAPAASAVRDPRLLGLGLVIGLAALTRNEAAWLGLTWAFVAWTAPALRGGIGSVGRRIAAIAVPGIVAVAVFAPWAVRDWAVFGSPLPGQAAANALSVTGFDIFAYLDPPTLSRYLAQGPGFIVGSRVDGLVHNLLNVLLFLGLPVSVIGLVALPWTARGRTLRPLLVFSLVTFIATTLLFPVATTWGTFLHAAGPVHVLLVVSCLLALDRLIGAVGRRRGWTRPVAWLGPALAIFGSLLFSVALLPSFGGGSQAAATQYRVLRSALADAGHPLDGRTPVITDFPIWMAEAERQPALALPNEPPANVADLADRFGAHLLVLLSPERGRWPAILQTDTAKAACFRPVALPQPSDATEREAIADVRVWDIACP